MAPTVLDAVLPDWISRDSTFFYEFYTDVFEAALSGADVRNAVWSDFRLKGDLATALAREATLNQVIALFLVAKGRAYAWKLRHPMDCEVVGQLLGVGDGTEQALQLVKDYEFELYSHQKTIYFPIPGTVTVYFDGAAQEGGWSLNYNTGVLTASPGAGVEVSADFEFYYPMRFDTDQLATQWESYKAGKATLPVVEVRG